MANNTGATIGTTTKVISIKSRIKPSKKITSITSSVAATIPPGRLLKNCSTTSSPPNPRNTREKIAAPIRIRNTIDVTSVVLWATSLSLARLSCPRRPANRVAPNAPTPAASVGVAAPVRIDPSTATIKNTGGNKLRIARDSLWEESCPAETLVSASWAGRENRIT